MAELALVPAPKPKGNEPKALRYWVWNEHSCAPYLGPEYGASPSCNRALVGPSGETSFLVPAGTYDVYATHGPFWSLAHARVSVQDGKTASVSLGLADLPLLPPKTLSGDFHVHAGPSFDSSLPERDRAITFVTAGLDVIAATDHNLVTNYDKVLADLGITGRVKVMPGMESTGHILFLRPPGSDVPKVIGHFNFWPLKYDRDEAHNGAPYDQKIEPGELYDRMDRAFTGIGIRQLNHPADSDDLGRDSAYLVAIGYDPRVPVPPKYESTPAGQRQQHATGKRGPPGRPAPVPVLRRAGGAGFSVPDTRRRPHGCAGVAVAGLDLADERPHALTVHARPASCPYRQRNSAARGGTHGGTCSGQLVGWCGARSAAKPGFFERS